MSLSTPLALILGGAGAEGCEVGPIHDVRFAGMSMPRSSTYVLFVACPGTVGAGTVCPASHVFAVLNSGTVAPLVPVFFVAAVPRPLTSVEAMLLHVVS
jgi:hypothetical protein